MKAYLITPGPFDRQRKLVLTEDYIEWETGDLKGQEFTRLENSDIDDFKHGMDWIVWYKFTVGRKFSITLRSKHNKQLSIEFKSYFTRNKENNQKYAEIINDIWCLYHRNIVDRFLDKFYSDHPVEVQGIRLTNEGIELRDAQGLIPWEKVAIKEYNKYFAVYHRDNSTIHSRVNFNEYGTETLWSIIHTVLKEKALE